ncbi:hypothetical protein M9Y10_005121 [Tritrichomonas musculus]|uniref:Ubiquitin-like domain-containing protein n=1 Tax=Tritrichomonas musculus TaxID=1915356 RepID=A0ABR2JKD1_9EUKA
MRIIIRSLRDNPFFIEVDEQATIFCVKSAIFQINGVFPSHQSIIYQGNVLSNETTLPSLNFPTNKQASLYLVISKKQRERLQEEQEQKESYSSKSLLDSHPKPDLFSSSPNSINQGLGIQNNACFDSIMKNITDKSPNFSHALNDKEALYESYDAFRDPGKRLELLKSIDRTLNLVESKAGCYRDIIEHQRLVTEAVDDAIDKYMHEVNPKYYETLNKTVIPEKPLDAPSCEPIEMDLNQSENFMDSLLQRQLMLVMTLPNGTQKLVTVKKNIDAVLKIMQLMANLQEKSQKNKMKKDNENLKPINSFFGTENNTSSFDFDTNNDSCDNDNSNENEGNFGFGNGLKQLEIDNQLNLLKILMMSILSDENRDNNNNDNENKSNPFFHSGVDNNKNDNLFDEEFESGSNRNNQSIFGWNGLFGENSSKNNKTKNNLNNNTFQKQPKYEQVFHKSEPSPPPTQSSQLLFDMDSETDSQSNFCFSSNSDFQSFDEDDDCFFNNDYFTKNSPTSFNSGSFVQPRSNGHRNTTYYSPTADSIRTTREERKSILDYKNEKRFNFNCDESNNNNNNSDENVMEDQNDIEEKRRKGWKMIYDLVNTSQGCDLEEEEEQNIKDNNNNNHDNDEYQNTFNFNEDEDDSSDISID